VMHLLHQPELHYLQKLGGKSITYSVSTDTGILASCNKLQTNHMTWSPFTANDISSGVQPLLQNLSTSMQLNVNGWLYH